MRKTASQSPTPRGSPACRAALTIALSPIAKAAQTRKISTRPSTGTLRGPSSPLFSPQSNSPTPQSTVSHTHLSKLRSLRHSSRLQITPQLAAEVVKDYLLPLFETETRHETDKLRGETFGLNNQGDTILSELRLSSRLLTELKEIQGELERARKELTLAKASEQTAVMDLMRYQAELVEEKTKIRFLTTVQSEKVRSTQHNAVYLSSQLRQAQTSLSEEELKSKRFSTLLQEERGKSDKLRNRTIELEYTNSLLRMENDIMGDKLKGLYQAMEGLVQGKGEAERVKGELEWWKEAGKELGELMDQLTSELNSCLLELDSLRSDNSHILHQRQESIDEKMRLARTAKDRIQSLHRDLQIQEDENAKLKLEAEKMEKRMQDLTIEFGKLRTKMTQYKQRRKAYGEAEERICRHCQKVYIESENYNWSCRIHQSEYGEDMWWCCGQPAKEAPGCRISKHESKDDEEDEEDLEKKVQRRAMQKCSV